MDNMTPDVEMSLAIVLRSVLEHTEPDSPLGWHAEMVEKWVAEKMKCWPISVTIIGGTYQAPPAKEEQVVHD